MSSSNPGPAITTGSTSLGGGSPQQIGGSATAQVGFYGVTPLVQRSGAAQVALASTTATSGGFGFVDATSFNAFTAQLEEIRATMAALGIFKGAA
jgi:hypothetical protein